MRSGRSPERKGMVGVRRLDQRSHPRPVRRSRPGGFCTKRLARQHHRRHLLPAALDWVDNTNSDWYQYETESMRENRHEAFGSISNFEVKHHGPMPVDRWIPVERNIRHSDKLVDPLTRNMASCLALVLEVAGAPVQTM